MATYASHPHRPILLDRSRELRGSSTDSFTPFHAELTRRANTYERELYAFFAYQGASHHEAERRAFNIATSWKHGVILDHLRASLAGSSPASPPRVVGEEAGTDEAYIRAQRAGGGRVMRRRRRA